MRDLPESGLCSDCGLNPGAEVMQFDHVPELGEATRRAGKVRACVRRLPLAPHTLRRLGRVYVRLPETAKAAIRRRRAAGERVKDLAFEYGIT